MIGVSMNLQGLLSFIAGDLLPGYLDRTIFNPRFFLFENPIVSRFKKTIEVPKDLSPITVIDAPAESDPAEVDMTRAEVASIWARVEDLYRTGIHPAIVFCLRRNGKVLLNRSIGHRRGNGPDDSPESAKVLMTPDTPICQFSASKAVTAMLVHLLAERNEIDLLDPVSHYLPEFAAKGKQNTTIWHLMTHHGGIPTPPSDASPELLYDPESFVRLLCESTPESPGGRRMAYHAITAGAILGEIIRRVSGRSIREFLDESIVAPLGFRYFNFGLPASEHHRLAVNYTTGLPLVFPLSVIPTRTMGAPWEEVVRLSNEPRFMETIIPAGNLVATADEMSRFFQLLLNGGELDGVRIFKPLTIRRAVLDADTIRFDGTMIVPMRYSAGFMLGSSPVSLWGPFTPSVFGHFGFINIMNWADPDRGLAVSLQTTGKSLYGSHLLMLARLLAEISSTCRSIEGNAQVGDVCRS
jgi:CubicO group peptidase (beta-lactamase class C family)